MAAVAEIVPADTAIEVGADVPVWVNITDAVAVDPAKVEVIVNGESCTVANGLLEFWNHQAIVGGAIVDDYTDVWFGTLARWYDISNEVITIDVEYDGANIETITVRTSEINALGSAAAHYGSMGVEAGWRLGGLDMYYQAIDPGVELTERGIYYYVEPAPDGSFDAWYYVGRYLTTDGPTAVIVGERCMTDGPAAVVVLGGTVTDGLAAIVVQGWRRTDGAANVLPAEVLVVDGYAGMLPATQSTTDGSAAAIVYGVNRGTHVEIRSITDETEAILAALGVSRA